MVTIHIPPLSIHNSPATQAHCSCVRGGITASQTLHDRKLPLKASFLEVFVGKAVNSNLYEQMFEKVWTNVFEYDILFGK